MDNTNITLGTFLELKILLLHKNLNVFSTLCVAPCYHFESNEKRSAVLSGVAAAFGLGS